MEILSFKTNSFKTFFISTLRVVAFYEKKEHDIALLFLILVFCPDGWYSSRGVCMKAFESSTGLTYAQAVTSCQSMGSDIAQPNNEIDSQTLSDVLANFTTNMTTTKFWIGKIKIRIQCSLLNWITDNWIIGVLAILCINWIIRIPLSLFYWPMMILLGGGHFINNYFLVPSFSNWMSLSTNRVNAIFVF